jgi:hypothetical protein
MKLKTILASALLLAGLFVWLPASAQNSGGLPGLTCYVSSTDSSSAVVTVVPALPGTPDYVAGVADYRIRGVNRDGSLNTTVKYFGLDYGSAAQTPPFPLEISVEINDMLPKAATYVIEAVSQLGPAPMAQSYNAGNTQLTPMKSSMAGCDIIGGNMGMTPDGLTSINGQGPTTDVPVVLARSAPFAAAGTGKLVLPSQPGESQIAQSQFNGGTVSEPTIGPLGTDTESMTLTTTNKTKWAVQVNNADTRDTSVFIQDRHLMDVLFDGGTPGSNNPLHQGHGALAISPMATFDFSGGKILHATAEFDAQFENDGRRWIAFDLAPVGEPITDFDFFESTPNQVSATNRALFVQIGATGVTTDLYDTVTRDTPITGALGQAPIWTPRGGPWSDVPNGRGLDFRSTFNLYVSQSHVWLFQDGESLVDAVIPNGGLAWTKCTVSFVHYLYHSGNAENETVVPYWTAGGTVPTSDERHWDNLGVGVLPDGASVPAPVSAAAPKF